MFKSFCVGAIIGILIASVIGYIIFSGWINDLTREKDGVIEAYNRIEATNQDNIRRIKELTDKLGRSLAETKELRNENNLLRESIIRVSQGIDNAIKSNNRASELTEGIEEIIRGL